MMMISIGLSPYYVDRDRYESVKLAVEVYKILLLLR